jgi:2-polyprenyl-3-methyl-5-hydroxy-6-metoxy-1,4-benzoquinol methylase
MTTTRSNSDVFTLSPDSMSLESCPLCGAEDNPVAIEESGIEHRFGMPVLPMSSYAQALCRQCGLLYVNRRIDSDYLLRLYSQENIPWQKQYVGVRDATFQNVGSNGEELRRFARVVALASEHRDLRGVQWLDFGCQTGELGDISRRQYSARMAGVDVSEDYASRAASLWGDPSSVRTSITSFIDEGRRFDVITALETLEHLADPWETVRLFRAALTPDGLLVVSVPSAQYFRLKYHVLKAFRRVFSRRVLRERPTNTGQSVLGLCHTHIYNFSPKSLSLLLSKGGMSTIRVGGIGWSRKLWYFEAIARLISIASFGRVQLYPSVIAVAKIAD